LQAYLPEPLSADAVAAIIRQAIADTGAAGAKDMGKVMAAVKPQIAGRADMGAVSAQIKGALGS
jgi:uncharacterized protein